MGTLPSTQMGTQTGTFSEAFQPCRMPPNAKTEESRTNYGKADFEILVPSYELTRP
jgi:hypothetical protein